MEIPKDEVAYVTKIEGKNIYFSMKAGASCQSCGMHGICGGGESNKVEHVGTSDLKVNVDDKIRVTLDPSKRIISSLIIFILPLIILVIVYALAAYVVKLSEGYSILSAFGSLILSGFLIMIIDRTYGKKIKFKIVEILK